MKSDVKCPLCFYCVCVGIKGHRKKLNLDVDIRRKVGQMKIRPFATPDQRLMKVRSPTAEELPIRICCKGPSNGKKKDEKRGLAAVEKGPEEGTKR